MVVTLWLWLLLWSFYGLSFIQEIMAEQPLSMQGQGQGQNQDRDSASKTASSGIVNNNGRREWVPKNMPGNTLFQYTFSIYFATHSRAHPINLLSSIIKTPIYTSSNTYSYPLSIDTPRRESSPSPQRSSSRDRNNQDSGSSFSG